ncbi:MAG: 30S ribosomal protein S9 [Sediminibacterium sp.]|nr:30S ribosomal protein S9 [Sediminibacterium sp.]
MEKQKPKKSIGRRKLAITRVYMKKGTGTIIVNGKDYKNYFSLPYLQKALESPLRLTNTLLNYNINILANGGGIKGQAEAAQLGIARALVTSNPDYKSILKVAGFLTRDSRNVERKKFGHKKARKSFQFSKR